MTNKCSFCSPGPDLILKELTYSRLMIPKRLHVAPQDGGHLIVVPKRHVPSRIHLSEEEAIETWQLSLEASNCLSSLLSIDWFNFQENGNWTVDVPSILHLHLHIYGRSRSSQVQPFGESLRFPLKRDLANWKPNHFSEMQLVKIRKFFKSNS